MGYGIGNPPGKPPKSGRPPKGNAPPKGNITPPGRPGIPRPGWPFFGGFYRAVEEESAASENSKQYPPGHEPGYNGPGYGPWPGYGPGPGYSPGPGYNPGPGYGPGHGQEPGYGPGHWYYGPWWWPYPPYARKKSLKKD